MSYWGLNRHPDGGGTEGVSFSRWMTIYGLHVAYPDFEPLSGKRKLNIDVPSVYPAETTKNDDNRPPLKAVVTARVPRNHAGNDMSRLPMEYVCP